MEIYIPASRMGTDVQKPTFITNDKYPMEPFKYVNGMAVRLPGYNYVNGEVPAYWPGGFTPPNEGVTVLHNPSTILTSSSLLDAWPTGLFQAEGNPNTPFTYRYSGQVQTSSFRLVRPLFWNLHQALLFALDLAELATGKIDDFSAQDRFSRNIRVLRLAVVAKNRQAANEFDVKTVVDPATQFRLQMENRFKQIPFDRFVSRIESLLEAVKTVVSSGFRADYAASLVGNISYVIRSDKMLPYGQTIVDLFINHLLGQATATVLSDMNTNMRTDILQGAVNEKLVAEIAARKASANVTAATNKSFGLLDAPSIRRKGRSWSASSVKGLYFKILGRGGEAIHGGQRGSYGRGVFKWNLPTVSNDLWVNGQPEPPIQGEVRPCSSGYHLAPDINLASWLSSGNQEDGVTIWLAAFEVKGDNDAVLEDTKVAVREATLQRGFTNPFNGVLARVWVARMSRQKLTELGLSTHPAISPLLDLMEAGASVQELRTTHRPIVDAVRNIVTTTSGVINVIASNLYNVTTTYSEGESYNAVISRFASIVSPIGGITSENMESFYLPAIATLLTVLDTWVKPTPPPTTPPTGGSDTRPPYDETLNKDKCGNPGCDICYPNGYPFSTLPDGTAAPPLAGGVSAGSSEVLVPTGVSEDIKTCACGRTDEFTEFCCGDSTCPSCHPAKSSDEDDDEDGGDDDDDSDDEDDEEYEDDEDDEDEYEDDEDDDDGSYDETEYAFDDLDNDDQLTVVLLKARLVDFPGEQAAKWARDGHDIPGSYPGADAPMPHSSLSEELRDSYVQYGCPSALLAARVKVSGDTAYEAMSKLVRAATGITTSLTEWLQTNDPVERATALTDDIEEYLPTVVYRLSHGESY